MKELPFLLQHISAHVHRHKVTQQIKGILKKMKQNGTKTYFG
jgi:hypothetical protein